jgi:hypothetical protein
MTVMTRQERIAAPSITAPFATVMTVIFTGYLVIGIAMPALPLHVHQGLGYRTFLVGIVAVVWLLYVEVACERSPDNRRSAVCVGPLSHCCNGARISFQRDGTLFICRGEANPFWLGILLLTPRLGSNLTVI